MSKRKTAESKVTRVEELPVEERYTVVNEEDGGRVYFGDGVSQEEAERLAADLQHPAVIVRVVDL